MTAVVKTFALALVIVGALATAASAKCTKLGFSVNDYGKDGPTKDARDLLDKYIAKWAGERGIKKYSTGKKDVKCELYLDFGVFDEHTCRAEATVCWGEPGAPGTTTAAAKPASGASPVETGAISQPAAAPKEAAPMAAEPASEPKAAPAETK